MTRILEKKLKNVQMFLKGGTIFLNSVIKILMFDIFLASENIKNNNLSQKIWKNICL